MVRAALAVLLALLVVLTGCGASSTGPPAPIVDNVRHADAAPSDDTTPATSSTEMTPPDSPPRSSPARRPLSADAADRPAGDESTGAPVDEQTEERAKRVAARFHRQLIELRDLSQLLDDRRTPPEPRGVPLVADDTDGKDEMNDTDNEGDTENIDDDRVPERKGGG